MVDTFSEVERSKIMAAVKSIDTTPERVVSAILRGLGYRHRRNVVSLPGSPDIVLTALQTVIEVRGCFWHGHTCGACRIPATRRAYWTAKISRNTARDRQNIRKLRRLGWSALVIWECQTKDRTRLARRLSSALAKRGKKA